MSAYGTIVVGTDGSERSMRAVERAGALAADGASRLVIVCAYRPVSDREIREAGDALREDAYQVVGSTPAESSLRAAAGRARIRGAQDVATRAIAGDAPDALVKMVAEADADLLVVGNRGLNTLVGRLLGSVPSSVARHAGCDVTIVHTDH
jgi:nucleotide-binding universal stress UspA family protein